MIKKILVNYIGFFLCMVLCFAAFIEIIPDRFFTSYQRNAVRQMDYYRSISDDAKIVAIGNSAIVFGLDTAYLEELSGKKAVVLGNQVSFGYPYFMEASKEYLKPGDIVVIEIMDVDYWDVGTDMNLTGLGKRFDLYRFFPKRMWLDIVKRFPAVILKNVDYIINRTALPDGPYSINAFDENGNYVLERKDCVLSDPYEGEGGWTDFSDTQLDPEMIEAFNDYVSFCKNMGVSVFFTVRPECEDVILPDTLDDATMKARDYAYASVLDAPIISHTADYVYSREYIWDGHCNSAGQKLRTQMLYSDLKPYL